MAWPWWSAPTYGKSGREKVIRVDRSTIHFITHFRIFVYVQLFSYHCHIPWKLLAHDNKAHNRRHAEENDEWSPAVVSTRRFLELRILWDACWVSNFTQLQMSSHTYHSCFQYKAEGQSQPMGWWPKLLSQYTNCYHSLWDHLRSLSKRPSKLQSKTWEPLHGNFQKRSCGKFTRHGFISQISSEPPTPIGVAWTTARRPQRPFGR